jgi:DNA excision repair protein ERCC-3
VRDIEENIRRFGLLRLERREGGLRLVSTETKLLADIARDASLKRFFDKSSSAPDALAVPENLRGEVKQALIRIGYPVEDLPATRRAPRWPCSCATRHAARARPSACGPTRARRPTSSTPGGTEKGGSGVIVLPCGAGKTVVGIAALHRLQTQCLILHHQHHRRAPVAHRAAGQDHAGRGARWASTRATPRRSCPVTISTYQMITYRRRNSKEFTHFALFSARDWGLVVYDEVHLLPAPVFRVTAEIQARRRLGLTATLVREDGREDEVFSLIGPKKYDVPVEDPRAARAGSRRALRGGAAASAAGAVLRLPRRGSRERFRIASENPDKLPVIQRLVLRHADDRVLIIGQYLDQLDVLVADLKCPLISGRTPTREREDLYRRFRDGDLKLLAVSKVGNFAVDLPDANVAIQVSGTFGSRQEEAQRLGRILRPKSDRRPAVFYSLVTRDSREEHFANNRQLFLTEQGYTYEIRTRRWSDTVGRQAPSPSRGADGIRRRSRWTSPRVSTPGFSPKGRVQGFSQPGIRRATVRAEAGAGPTLSRSDLCVTQAKPAGEAEGQPLPSALTVQPAASR